MGVHAGGDPPHVLLAEPDSEPAADDHGLGVDQVDRRRDSHAEGLHGAIDESRRQVVAVLQGPLPNTAGQAVAAALLHDPEKVGFRARLHLLARLDLHRHPAGVGLHTALSPAGAAGASALHDDVPDLPSSAAAEPLLAVQDQATADTGSPPDAEHAVEFLAGTELDLALHRDRDVVADLDRRAESFR